MSVTGAPDHQRAAVSPQQLLGQFAGGTSMDFPLPANTETLLVSGPGAGVGTLTSVVGTTTGTYYPFVALPIPAGSSAGAIYAVTVITALDATVTVTADGGAATWYVVADASPRLEAGLAPAGPPKAAIAQYTLTYPPGTTNWYFTGATATFDDIGLTVGPDGLIVPAGWVSWASLSFQINTPTPPTAGDTFEWSVYGLRSGASVRDAFFPAVAEFTPIEDTSPSSTQAIAGGTIAASPDVGTSNYEVAMGFATLGSPVNLLYAELDVMAIQLSTGT